MNRLLVSEILRSAPGTPADPELPPGFITANLPAITRSAGPRATGNFQSFTRATRALTDQSVRNSEGGGDSQTNGTSNSGLSAPDSGLTASVSLDPQSPSEETSPPTPWQPHPRFQKPADDKGQFTGEFANSPFALSDAKADEMGLPRGTTIPWIKGTPDFDAHAVPGPNGSPRTYQVPGMTGDHDTDRLKMIRRLAKDNGVSQRSIKRWLAENEIRLHHSGGHNAQNVPKPIHDLHHSGGALEQREGN